MTDNSPTIEILLIEDNLGDIRLTEEALRDAKVKNSLNVVRSAEEGLDYLHKRGRYEGAVTPGVIFLDLHLPKKSGHDVLREVKTDPKLRRIPVFVMTSSEEQEDILKSYDLNANCVVKKPLTSDDFTRLVYLIDEFWFKIVKLPPSP